MVQSQRAKLRKKLYKTLSNSFTSLANVMTQMAEYDSSEDRESITVSAVKKANKPQEQVWSSAEMATLEDAIKVHGNNPKKIAEMLPGRTVKQVEARLKVYESAGRIPEATEDIEDDGKRKHSDMEGSSSKRQRTVEDEST